MIVKPELPEDGIPGLWQALGSIVALLRCHGVAVEEIIVGVNETAARHERFQAETKAMIDRQFAKEMPRCGHS